MCFTGVLFLRVLCFLCGKIGKSLMRGHPMTPSSHRVGVVTTLTAVLLLPCHRAVAQRATMWRGLSHCVSAAHPCSDEQVIYRVNAGSDSLHRNMSAAKIVGADTIDMGTLSLTRAAGSADWTARIPVGVWRFQIGRDSLTGTFTTNAGDVMRRISAKQQ
jgi:hypothetical protein